MASSTAFSCCSSSSRRDDVMLWRLALADHDDDDCEPASENCDSVTDMFCVECRPNESVLGAMLRDDSLDSAQIHTDDKQQNKQMSKLIDWLSSVLRPLQHSIGYMGDGFYRSKDTTNRIKVLKEKASLKIDWLIEQCFTSPPTQYRLYGRRLLPVKRHNQQYQSTEGEGLPEKHSSNIIRRFAGKR